MEGGNFRRNFAGKVVAGEINELKVDTLGNGCESSVKAVVTEVEKAEER